VLILGIVDAFFAEGARDKLHELPRGVWLVDLAAESREFEWNEDRLLYPRDLFGLSRVGARQLGR
jgi:hypothetical protein